MHKWGYLGMSENITCPCGKGDLEIDHMLKCQLSGGDISKDDLEIYNDRAKCCVGVWLDAV